MNDLYGAELARVHHRHFGDVAEAAALEILNRLDAPCEGKPVVDLGAGSGIVSRRLSEAGFTLFAIDSSPSMVELGRKETPSVHFEQASAWDYRLPASCAAVVAVGEVLSYGQWNDGKPALPDGLLFRERMKDFATALEPGGLLLFDVVGPGRSGTQGYRTGAWSYERSFLHLREEEERSAMRLRRQIDLFVPAGELYRRVTETHALRLYRRDDVRIALEQAGFTCEYLSGYSDTFSFRPGWYGFAATKRATP